MYVGIYSVFLAFRTDILYGFNHCSICTRRALGRDNTDISITCNPNLYLEKYSAELQKSYGHWIQKQIIGWRLGLL